MPYLSMSRNYIANATPHKYHLFHWEGGINHHRIGEGRHRRWGDDLSLVIFPSTLQLYKYNGKVAQPSQ